MLAGCNAAGSSPPASAGPSPSIASAPLSSADPAASSAGLEPYRLSLERSGQSPTPTRTISSAADCATLPSDWFVQLCSLTLRPHWQDIIGPHDPLNVPSGGESVTWWAAFGRAVIDQDTSICTDVSMRMWISLGSSLGAPPPAGSTPEPVHPIAACLQYFKSTLSKGPILISGPSYNLSAQQIAQDVVRLTAADSPSPPPVGPAPTFDPYIGCFVNALTRAQCTQMINAVSTTLGDRVRTITSVLITTRLFGCPSPASPCPAPAGGIWLGGVLAAEGEHAALAFDVALVDGQLQVVEVPYKP
jgi:hypothetical protein